MEGINMTGILLGYLALLLFALACLVALVLLIVHQTKAARMVFAAGLLGACVIAAIADLTFLESQGQERKVSTDIVITALALLTAGAGQFIAAFRRSMTYALAMGCVAASLVMLATPILAGDAGAQIPGANVLASATLTVWPWPSLILAIASAVIAVFLPARLEQSEQSEGRF